MAPALPALVTPVGAGGLTSHAWLHRLLDLVGSGPAGGSLRQCPAHSDASPSLSIAVADDGRILMHCHAGCSSTSVLESLHLSWRHLYIAPWMTPERHYRTWGRRAWPTFPTLALRAGHPAAAGLRLVAVHRYGDDGRWLLERWRSPASGTKDMRWTTRDEHGVDIPGLRGVPTSGLPLYQERQVRMAIGAEEPVALVESESSVDALTAAGVYSTTWAGGASSPPLERLARVLAGAHVVLVPDHDKPGLACGRRLWAALAPVVASLAFRMPEPQQDARDLLAARGPAAFINARPSSTHTKEQ